MILKIKNFFHQLEYNFINVEYKIVKIEGKTNILLFYEDGTIKIGTKFIEKVDRKICHNMNILLCYLQLKGIIDKDN